jgi:Raf kinase inhibitor-like YbhB/YbcL family protein
MLLLVGTAGVTAAVLATACAAPASDPLNSEAPPMTDQLTITSSAFTEGGSIPSVYTCDGSDTSPPLAWSGAPDGTAAYALIVDDPDARGWVHWLVADLPSEQTELAEGASGTVDGVEGRTDSGRTGYGGPCPPSGTHQYVFEVFALSEPLGLSSGFSADELRGAIEGKTLASGRLTASYTRGG